MANFGDISYGLSIGAGQSVRRNAGDSAFEAFTPGSGDVVGPASSVDGNLPLFNGTTGKLIKDSGLNPSNFINYVSTGLRNGAVISINADTTKFDISAGTLYFVDNTTAPDTPTFTKLTYAGSTANTATYLATANATYISLDSTGTIHQTTSPLTPTQRRDWTQLGVIVHSNRTVINAVNNEPEVIINSANQLYDLMDGIKIFNVSGNIISANGANLQINKSAGSIFKRGSNFTTDPKNPHIKTTGVLTAPATLRYRLRDGTEYTDTNSIDPNYYDNAGVKTAVSSNKFTIQRIVLFPSNLIRIQYGQNEYSTMAAAVQAIPSETFVVEQNMAENGLLIALLIVQQGTTNLSTATSAKFTQASKFGDVSSTTLSSGTATLQQAYNNSVQPQITTSTAMGSVQIKRGSASDNDHVQEWLNGAGTVKAYVDGNGNFIGNGNVITKEPTGFTDPDNVVINYDPTTQTVTLTGTVTAYYQGVDISVANPTFTSGWVSPAHTNTTGHNYFLAYDGATFSWYTDTFPGFDKILIANVFYGATDKFCIRECHGLMQWQGHKEAHNTIGTYRSSGGLLSNYVTGSTTATDRRPDVSAAVINDEDLPTTNPALTSKLYTKIYNTGTGTSTTNFTVETAEIIPLSGSQPYWNEYTGGAWQQTLMSNNSYTSVWLFAIPVTASTTSQKYRFLWLQGQTNGTLAQQQARTPGDLDLGTLASITPEFICIAQVIIQYTGGNWNINSVKNITGSRFSQSSSSAIIPTSHSALSNLSWTVSGHTGTNSTVAAFDGSGNATLITTSTLATLTGTQTLTNKTFDDELRLKQIATPANPSAGYNKLYFKSDDKLYKLTSGGTESEIGSVTGTGVSGQISYWGGTSSQAGDTKFLFDSTNKRVAIGDTSWDGTNPETLKVQSGTTTSVNCISGYGTINNYLQMNIKNSSSGASASSDVVATANTGTETTNYVDLGINSSAFSSASWTINGALDGYLYSQSTGLAIGTATSGKNLVLFTGGTLAANTRLTLTDNGITQSATTGTMFAQTMGNNYNLGGIGFSITLGNTQIFTQTLMSLDTGTNGGNNTGIKLVYLSGNGSAVGGITGNDYGSALQATGNVNTIKMGTNFNTSSNYSSKLIHITNEQNAGAGNNTGIYIENKSTEFVSGSGTGIYISQTGVAGTGLHIAGGDNVNTSTNGLFYTLLSNTQSAATVAHKIDLGTAAVAHKGIYIKAVGASTTQTGIEIDLSTTGTGSHLRLTKGTAAGAPVTEGDLVYNGTNLYFKPSGTAVDLLAAGAGLSWGASITGTSGTGLTTAIGASASASTIAQSITIDNTQTNACVGLNVTVGTADVRNVGIKLNSTYTGDGGRMFIDYNQNPVQALSNSAAGLSIGYQTNTNSAVDYSGIRMYNQNNAGAGKNTGISLTNASTEFTAGGSGSGIFVNQTGAGGTSAHIYGGDNVNTSTNGLVNFTLSNTQSGASVVQKIDSGSSSQAHTGLLITGSNGSSTYKGLSITNTNNSTIGGIGLNIGDQSTTWQGFYTTLLKLGSSVNAGTGTNTQVMIDALWKGNFEDVGRTTDLYQFKHQTNFNSTNHTDNFNVGYFKRENIINASTKTLTSQGSVLKVENVATQTAGTLTDSVDILQLVRPALSTGSALNITIPASVTAPTNGFIYSVLNNTQSNACVIQKIDFGTSTAAHVGLQIVSKQGQAIEINKYGSATQAVANSIGIDLGANYNTSSAYTSALINIVNQTNASTGWNTGIAIDNKSDYFSATTSGVVGSGIGILQSGVGGTALGIFSVNNVNIGTTKALVNFGISDTQSGASTVQKISTGTSAQAHIGLSVIANNATANSIGVKIDIGANGTGYPLYFATGGTGKHAFYVDPGFTTTSASAGSTAVPANCVGFLIISVEGADRKIPYFN